MACAKCARPAVARIRYSGQVLCRDHFLRFFDRRAKTELACQGRLPEGRVAVALSGGKDSVAVLHFLHRVAADDSRVDLVAVTVDEGIAGYRDASMDACRAATRRLGVPWHVVRTKDIAGYDIDAYAAGQAGPDATGRPRAACGPCGVFRRRGIDTAAKETGAVAVVTGHNLDDMAQTILMNHMKGDVERLGRLAPHTRARDGLVPRLVPFRSIPEKEVLLYAVLHDLSFHDAECPYAARSHRFAMRDVLVAIERQHPGTRHALLRGAERIRALLPDDAAVAPSCRICGGPTSAAVCKACQYREAVA